MDSYIKLANTNNNSELQAFLELDTKRYQVKTKLMSKFQHSKKALNKYLELANIEKSVVSKNQFPQDSFHTILAKKIDEKRSRTEAQNIHEDLLTHHQIQKTSLTSLM